MSDVIDTPPPTPHSIAAYWLATIRRMVCGATLEGVTEDHVFGAVLEGIDEAQAIEEARREA